MTPQSSTFSSCMHDQMLESNRDDVKLEAMRCVTVMTAKGKLTVPRTLFPHIVKNVTSKNPELKKLIYLYLTNFADQEPDMALLPVATLQKSLKSPNPLVRSSALKVLTSMRLNILTAILMASLQNSVNDLSPYVRKTVAHSIIKIYRLDPTLKEDLIEYIERLFNDKNSMVLSSAVATFEVVCPDKLDLVHKHYRRFCFVLADCNEWGQAVLLQLLMRYVIKTYGKCQDVMIKDYNPSEHDPKILLRSSKPLVHSNNSAVVMAVIKLYIAIANFNEIRSTITRPLIRLLYSRREIQLTVLNMIDELTSLDNDTSKSVAEGEESDDEVTSESIEPIEKQDLKENSSIKLDQLDHDGVSEKDVQISLKQAESNEKPIPDQPITKDGYIALDCENGTDNQTLNKESGVANDSGENIEQNAQKSECEGEEDEEEEDEESGDDDEEGSSEDEEDSDEEDEDDSEDDEEDEVLENASNIPEKEAVYSKPVFDSNLIDFQANKEPSAFREVFRPYIKSFFIKHTDCTQIRLAKLRVLTNLSSSVNVTLVLRELQAYISSYVDDKEFVSAAIHAIGRCAIIVKEVAHTCLNGLTSLLSNNNEHIVSEAIVVLRSQIINKRPTLSLAQGLKNGITTNSNSNNNNNDKDGTDNHSDEKLKTDENNKTVDDNDEESEDNVKIVSTVIKQVTKLLPTVTAPQARATILWILAEFCDNNLTAAKCAPEVLRSIAKSFCQEDNFVKLQSLTLASKFLLSLDKEKKSELHHKVQLLTGYLFSLAKYDINHDVRDRGRFLKKLLEEEEICSQVLNCTPVVN